MCDPEASERKKHVGDHDPPLRDSNPEVADCVPEPQDCDFNVRERDPKVRDCIFQFINAGFRIENFDFPRKLRIGALADAGTTRATAEFYQSFRR